MPRRAGRARATYRDVVAAPEWIVAEVVDGELHQSPRPSLRHAFAESRLLSILEAPFGRGLAGPGGWIVLAEPEIHLDGDEVIVVPDLAAWREERLRTFGDEPFSRTVPDWVCEIVSPSSERFDREKKLPIYAQSGVGFAWVVDPRVRTLEVLVQVGGRFEPRASHREAALVRAEPFAAVEIDLAALWRA